MFSRLAWRVVLRCEHIQGVGTSAAIEDNSLRTYFESILDRYIKKFTGSSFLELFLELVM
jgi:hypothetical protein